MLALMIASQLSSAEAIAAPILVPAEQAARLPSEASRALGMERVAAPVASARFRFQCLVRSNGVVEDCIAADDGGTADIAEYRKRLYAGWPDAATAQGAAFARLRFWRMHPVSTRPRDPVPSVLIDETVSPGDARPAVDEADPLPPGEIVLAGLTDPVDDFYPPDAIRAGVQARVTVPCRVLADMSLLCGHALVDIGDPTRHQYDASFERATRAAFAAMRAAPQLKSGGSSAGRVGIVSMAWRLPRDY